MSEAASFAASSTIDPSPTADAGASRTRAKRPALTSEQAVAAAFIADLSSELLKLARDHRFRHLAYLLDLATLEARNLARRNDGPSTASTPIPSQPAA